MRALSILLVVASFGCKKGAGGANGSNSDAAVGDLGSSSPDDASTSQGAALDLAPPPGSDLATVPATTTPQPFEPGFRVYPRVIRKNLAPHAGSIFAMLSGPAPTGGDAGNVFESSDDGQTFVLAGRVQGPELAPGSCCATLFELPRPLGALAAGTLLWATSIGGPSTAPMSIQVWQSADAGRTWAHLSTVVQGPSPRHGGLWEPELSLLDDGTLVCHWSDETDPAHSQKLIEARSSDGVHWGQFTNTVAPANAALRPGMANVRRLPNGTFLMSYEVCGDGCCNVHIRASADGWSWGDPNLLGAIPTTVDGKHFCHAPTLTFADKPGNGRLYLIGQITVDGNNNPVAENGAVMFANTEGSNQFWFEVKKPVAVPAPNDNFCPNYSSSLLAVDDGKVGVEVATKYDGQLCRAYFARGPIRGSGDATGADSGKTYRLVNVMSGLCLDVSAGSTAAGGSIEQWTCNGLTPQNWLFTKQGDGSFTLKAQNSGLCLTVNANSTTPGAPLEQQPCDGRSGQSFQPRNQGVGYFDFVHSGTGACVDDSGGSISAGTKMEQWTCNDLAPQLWQLQPR